MSGIAEFYLDNAGLLFLAAFLAATVVLLVTARRTLPLAWWAGALVSGVAVAGLATMIALALRGLDAGDSGVSAEGWLAVAAAGLLGVIGGLDVQLVIGALRAERGGTPTVIAGALIGPAVVVGGYLLLVRSMDWVRFGFGT